MIIKIFSIFLFILFFIFFKQIKNEFNNISIRIKNFYKQNETNKLLKQNLKQSNFNKIKENKQIF
jgi:predicted PurR-regulated permease PerM